MNDRKILFTDLDDTLLTTDKRVSESDLKSIDKMVSLGHHFVVDTGRPLPSAMILAREYGFDREGYYLACNNGGLLYYPYEDRVLASYPVPLSLVDELFCHAREAGLHIHTYTKTHVLSERITDELIFYCNRIKVPFRISNPISEELTEEPIKLIVMSLKGRYVLDEFRASHEEYFAGRLLSTFSNDALLEYARPETTKGNAVKFFCNYFGVPIENAIACGDEENDITMLDVAGTGVAMKNGTDLCKTHADYTTSHTNNESAITEVIEKFIL